MMPDGLSVRQWQERFRAGAFDSKDAAVQREAGWWDWHCHCDALAGRLKRIAPVVMGIKSPFILDQCSVWFCNESTDHELVYDSARFEPLHGSLYDLVFMVDHKDPRQPDKWTLYIKRFGFHASEFGCGHVHDMVRYIDNVAHELELGIMPPFLAEKAAAVEYILHRPVIYPSRSLRREGEHGYSFLDRDDGQRKMIYVARSLEDAPAGFVSEQAHSIKGMYVYCPEDVGLPLSNPQKAGEQPPKKKGRER